MIFLIAAILSSACISVLMRLSEAKVKNSIGMLVVNYVTCTALAAGFAFSAKESFLPLTDLSAGMGILNGVIYPAAFILLNASVRANGVALSATFMKLGILVPMAASMVIFHEMPTALRWIGFAAALAAIFMIRGATGGSAATAPGLLPGLLICGGMADVMSKFYQELGDPNRARMFLVYTFLTALILCVIYALIRDRRFTRWEALFGVVIGIPNFLSTKFLLASLGSLPAVVVYPTYSVATILVTSVTGMAVFGEQLNRRQKIALAIIMCALVLLNI